jgi:hypothetical protein
MNEKDTRRFITLFIISIIFIIASGAGCFFIGRADTADSSGIEQHLSRERELLARIGEYQRREEERNRREAERIAAEGERIKRTEAAIRAVRETDRRSGALLQELAKEVDVLADYFWSSRDSFNNGIDNSGSE